MDLLLLGFAVAVIFFVISQKNVYEFTNKFIGDELDELGNPTQKGLLIHAVVAGVLFYVTAYLLKKK
jgi:uncharacterized protein (DUF2062 family)